jgi:hypothetical protein
VTAHGEQLDATTLRMEVDPQNLLEEVEAQLRVASAWMSERGIAQRCRLAKNQAEVVGALIELERQGRAVSQDRDTALALWRSASSSTPAPQQETPERGPETQVRRRGVPVPAGHPLRKFRITTPEPPTSAAANEQEVPVARKYVNRRTPILAALQGGPLTLEQICAKTGFDEKPVSECLAGLKGKQVRGPVNGLWSLVSGAAVTPPGSRKARGSAPPRKPSTPPLRSDLRWLLGSDGSVRIERDGTGIELTPAEFDTLRRAHQVVLAARLHVEG